MTTPAPPVPTSAFWLGEWLQTLLDHAAVILGTDAPKRRYVSPGEPVPDCDQLTVHVDRLRTGAGSQNQLTRPQVFPDASLNTVTVAEVQVMLWRCGAVVTNHGPPSTQQLSTDGVTMARLGQALWYGLIAASADGTLWSLQNKPAVLWRAGTQVAPHGGLAAWRISGEVSLT